MPTELPEAEPHAATALIAHLRERPEDARKNPAELASQFGLTTSFVRSVLASAGPVRRPEVQHFQLVLDLSSVSRGLRWLAETFDRASAEPMVFVAWTTLMCVTACALLTLLLSMASNQMRAFALPVIETTLLITFFLHMTCYFRRAMMRYALQGGLFVWVVVAIVFLVTTYHEEHQAPSLFLLRTQLVIIVLTMTIGAVYASMGAMATLLGGWAKLKFEERHDEQLSRQELLEQYFELQTRLESSAATIGKEPIWSHYRLVRAFRRWPLLVSFLAGLFVSLPVAIFAFAAPHHAPVIDRPSGFLFLLQQATCTMLMMPVYIAIGFFSRGLRTALANTTVGRLGAMTTMLLPILGNADAQTDWFVANSLLLIPLGLISQVGAKMQSNMIRSENLKRGDQATIVAEMLRIQWRLSDHKALMCVMCVDAAKSSEMKSQADPLAVEYSFRMYQQWIDATCAPYGGGVHSTAGDGAVVAFRDCRQAFLAARRLQTDLARFNREENRLRSPFRLRIGLHVGQVAGDLDEVVFTEVIDIAAHVQSVAPVSGIAVTEEVAGELQDQEFIPLTKTVDGHGVALALNPIED